MTQIVSESAVDLMEVLTNKEARVARQQEWLKSHSLPLISFSINMPGPVKMNEASWQIFQQGVEAIMAACLEQNWLIVTRQILQQKTGPEAIFVVDVNSALDLKRAMMAIENTHRLGRLMDLDVIGTDGKVISRQGQQMARRKCLICDEDAVVCARSRRHTLKSLLDKISDMISHD